MARPQQKRVPKDAGRKGKPKVCQFCKDKTEWIDYKDVNLLRRFMSDRGKIRARRVTGNCAQHQRDVALAIKTARELALLPYTQRTTSDRPGPRGGRGRPPEAEQAAEVGVELSEEAEEGSSELAVLGSEDEA